MRPTVTHFHHGHVCLDISTGTKEHRGTGHVVVPLESVLHYSSVPGRTMVIAEYGSWGFVVEHSWADNFRAGYMRLLGDKKMAIFCNNTIGNIIEQVEWNESERNA